MWCYKVPYGISNACIMWILLKMPVLASFADAKLLDFPQATHNVLFICKIRIQLALYTVCTYN